MTRQYLSRLPAFLIFPSLHTKSQQKNSTHNHLYILGALQAALPIASIHKIIRKVKKHTLASVSTAHLQCIATHNTGHATVKVIVTRYSVRAPVWLRVIIARYSEGCCRASQGALLLWAGY